MDTIVEPFAGAAGYSCHYPARKVILIDASPIIAGIWRYLIAVSPAEVLAIPDIPEGGTVDDLPVCQEARWLIGTWQALIGTTAFVAIFYIAAPFAKEFVGAPLFVVQLGLTALGLAVVYAIALIQPRPHIKYFDRVFPLVFWAQGVLFGALHFGNLYSQSIAIPLLMTLPLIVCGWLWGYARVVLGLPAAFVLHIAYNVPSAVGMVALMAMRA
jgi:hypothetical protein